MKNIICRKYNEELIIKYHTEILSEGLIPMFLDTSFEHIEGSKSVNICYDITDVEPLVQCFDGERSPYIALSLIRGMEDAINLYLMPENYSVKKDFAYIDKAENIKLAYEPSDESQGDEYNPGKNIRSKTLNLIMEIYGDDLNSPSILSRDILKKVIEDLSDINIGLETCKRRLEKSKEKTKYLDLQRENGDIDLSNGIV